MGERRDGPPSGEASVVRPTLLYISSEAVIPAKARLGEAWAGIQLKSLDSPVSSTGQAWSSPE